VYKNGSSPSKKTLRRGLVLTSAIAALALTAAPWIARAEQPPPPCHPNPLAAQDEATVRNRGDIVNLPMPLKDRLAQLANRPHSQLPTQAYAEADKSSQLFQYYLLDTNGFQPNVFTRIFPGINDQAQLSVTGGKLRTADSGCGAPRAGAQARAANGS
jgi:hypothetical protein